MELKKKKEQGANVFEKPVFHLFSRQVVAFLPNDNTKLHTYGHVSYVMGKHDGIWFNVISCCWTEVEKGGVWDGGAEL